MEHAPLQVQVSFPPLDPQICYDKDAEIGALAGKIITFVSALFSLIALIAFRKNLGLKKALALGVFVYLAAGYAINKNYHRFRNRDYHEAGEALKKEGFVAYIRSRGLKPTIDTIISTYNDYKTFAAQQTEETLDDSIL